MEAKLGNACVLREPACSVISCLMLSRLSDSIRSCATATVTVSFMICSFTKCVSLLCVPKRFRTALFESWATRLPIRSTHDLDNLEFRPGVRNLFLPKGHNYRSVRNCKGPCEM